MANFFQKKMMKKKSRSRDFYLSFSRSSLRSLQTRIPELFLSSFLSLSSRSRCGWGVCEAFEAKGDDILISIFLLLPGFFPASPCQQYKLTMQNSGPVETDFAASCATTSLEYCPILLLIVKSFHISCWPPLPYIRQYCSLPPCIAYFPYLSSKKAGKEIIAELRKISRDERKILASQLQALAA